MSPLHCRLHWFLWAIKQGAQCDASDEDSCWVKRPICIQTIKSVLIEQGHRNCPMAVNHQRRKSPLHCDFATIQVIVNPHRDTPKAVHPLCVCVGVCVFVASAKVSKVSFVSSQAYTLFCSLLQCRNLEAAVVWESEGVDGNYWYMHHVPAEDNLSKTVQRLYRPDLSTPNPSPARLLRVMDRANVHDKNLLPGWTAAQTDTPSHRIRQKTRKFLAFPFLSNLKAFLFGFIWHAFNKPSLILTRNTNSSFDHHKCSTSITV